MEASPAPGGGASTPSGVTTTVAGPSIARNSMANPSGVGAGAPVRNFLNENVAGYVKRAMLSVWEARPQHPLTWVGEYLISCDIKYNGAPSEESQKHFIYHKNGIDYLLQHHTTTTGTTAAPDTSATAALAVPSSTPTSVVALPDNPNMEVESSDFKKEEQVGAETSTQEAVNGTGDDDSDQEMKDS